MSAYLVRRLLVSIPTLLGVTLLIFLAMRVLPGDPLAVIHGEGAGFYTLKPHELQAARASLGLDKPLHRQYLDWLWDIARGDLGKSFWRGEPISELLWRRGPITAQIAVMAVLFSWLIGLPVGILSATQRNSWVDYVARFFVTLFMAIPGFWIGLVVVLVGILLFTWRPPLTIVYFWDRPWENLQMTLGPALVLGIGVAAFVARMTRSTVLEVLREDYVRTARAKGVRERVVLWRHVLKNAILPVITVSGIALGGLLGGSVPVERAFGVPGLGTALVFAYTERDWMVVQNLVLLYGCIFVLINLLVDLSYGWLDPRIRYQ
jgi:peptide/nickel transport system permease protein